MTTCDWCGEALWRFRCATCNPRSIIRLCIECTKRWHAYGYSRGHELEDSLGVARVYTKWIEILADETLESDDAVASAASGKEPPHSISSASCDQIETNGIASTSLNKSTNDHQSVGAICAPLLNTSTNTATNGDVAKEATLSKTEEVQVEDTILDPDEVAEVIAEVDEMELEEVLLRYPTEESTVLDALAHHIHQALRMEDAMLCDRYNKCKESPCVRLLSHECHDGNVCLNNPTCAAIQRYKTHVEACKRPRVCPFCVRIHQRRVLGKRQCLEYMLSNQKRELRTLKRSGKRGSDVNAREGFLKSQIAVNERKKQLALDEIEKWNRVVLDAQLPIFNFPRYAWHLEEIPFIKNEPEPVVVDQIREKPIVPPVNSPIRRVDQERRVDKSTPVAATTSTATTSSLPDIQFSRTSSRDYVSELLDHKNVVPAKAKLETMIQLAFRIVDAQFCSPMRASKCLLHCQEIMLHLQHHIDLQVCSQTTCRAVEFHFEHISKCNDPQVCEYCLRVTEREYARAVEVMEADQVDGEENIRSLINRITQSLVNDVDDEREQNIMQLEDELQQAEDYKKELLEKLDAARLNVRKTRRRMQRHPSGTALPTSIVSGLPLHFIKQSPTPSKRRKT